LKQIHVYGRDIFVKGVVAVNWVVHCARQYWGQ
jgi:hypothetical protein